MTRRLVVLLALTGLASCGSPRGTTGPGSGAGASKEHAMQELDDALAQARQDSRSHFSIDTLPARKRLAAAAAAVPRAWEQRPPLDQFFLFAVHPDAAVQAGRQRVASAYGAALESLIADWWGLPGSVRTDPASQFVALGADAEPVLLDLLGRDAPLTYDDGEANTLARHLGLQVADLAAGLLAAIRGQRYDWRADADARRGARELLKQPHG
jgi:hypothetical protein